MGFPNPGTERAIKTVMILAANFPPTGGVGVIRTLKFVKYLPSFGWEPIVVTLPSRSEKIIDDSLLVEIPSTAEVHRPFFFDYRKMIPGDIAKLIRPIEGKFNFPDKYVQWNHFAFKYIEDKILPKTKIDLIYTSVGPHSTLLLAQKLKQHFSIPFVVDLRDPFSFSQYSILDSKNRWSKKARKIEKSVFNDADHINNVSKIWKEKYERLYPEIVAKSSLIPNGYDEEDFKHLTRKTRNKIFTIGYNGTFSRIVPIEPLIAAMIEIHKTEKISIRLSIATPIKLRKLKSKYPYLFHNSLIDHKGFLPHKESLQKLYQSDTSILILNDIPAIKGMIPAKAYEYLRLNRPILLLHRKGSFLSKLIEDTSTGFTVNINDRTEIVKGLLTMYKNWENRKLDHNPNWEEIRKYERRYLTQKLSNIFNRLI